MLEADETWLSQALCYGRTDLFFVAGTRTSARTPQDLGKIHRALSICEQCEVKPDCLKYAMANPQWGIWGGMTMDERERIRKGHTRKRPGPPRQIITGLDDV
jgi:WhiB family redox-sensing transcriptional regulator